MRYAKINRYDGFKDGICTITWTLFPDGMYLADDDVFGMEANDEEIVYAIIDTELDIIELFRPIENIEGCLKKLRKIKRKNK